MNQYHITALDFTDDNALERRMNTRPRHLEMVNKLKSTNNFILAAAIINEQGNMIGSSMVVQFEEERELNAWFAEEPYLLEKVWEKVDVKSVKVASVVAP